MVVFSDYHHDGLYTSLQYLFEDRLEGNLYRPIGEEWFPKYWKLAEPYGNHPSTVLQFLGTKSTYHPEDGTRPLNDIKERRADYYVVKGAYRDHKAITLERFKEMKFDYVIASYKDHVGPYLELVKKFQPQAKFIHQMGNNWPVDFNLVKNLMASTVPMKVPSNLNAIFYHQEFDLNIFKFIEPIERKRITSFVHCLPDKEVDYNYYQIYEKRLQDFEFKSYGTRCKDGVLNGWDLVSQEIADCSFGWHLKEGGDGYGHIIHNFFACGRPPIVRSYQYAGQLAEALMEDEVTCLDLDKQSLAGNVARIERYSEPELHDELCRNAYNRFCEVVDFDKEAEELKEFLGRCK